MLGRLTATSPTWTTLPLRIALGVVFIAHGGQKVFGLWGGPGLTKFGTNPAPFDWMQPAPLWMYAAAIAEFVGGTLVLLGLLTRLGALMIIPVMLVAILGVHWKSGFFLQNMGYEYAFTLLALAIALVISGGGRLSIDERLANDHRRRR
jgi:putative oxidoreductase